MMNIQALLTLNFSLLSLFSYIRVSINFETPINLFPFKILAPSNFFKVKFFTLISGFINRGICIGTTLKTNLRYNEVINQGELINSLHTDFTVSMLQLILDEILCCNQLYRFKYYTINVIPRYYEKLIYDLLIYYKFTQ